MTPSEMLDLASRVVPFVGMLWWCAMYYEKKGECESLRRSLIDLTKPR